MGRVPSVSAFGRSPLNSPPPRLRRYSPQRSLRSPGGEMVAVLLGEEK